MNIKICSAILMMVMAFSVFAAETVPGNQAKKNGFRTCQKTVDALANFVTKGSSDSSSLATWNKHDANNRLFNSQLAVKYSDGNSIAILNVTPTKDGKCDSSYTTVFQHDKSCSAIRETTFKEWKYFGELAGLTALENQDGTVNIILLPSVGGCTSIKTEVAYD